MKLSLSQFTDADRSEVLDLWSASLPFDAITEDAFETRVLLDENFDPSTVLLARDNGKLAGFIVGVYARRMPLGDADPKGTRSWITVLGLDPQGSVAAVGESLIGEVEKRFRALGKTECFVSNYPPGYFTPGIDLKAYKPLIELFRSCGYVAFHEALSMDAKIVLLTIAEKVRERERTLQSEGICVRPYRRTDLLKFLGFLEQTMPTDWVRVERRNLRRIAEGGFGEDQITVVAKGDDIIGYCQFEGSHFGPFGVSEQFQAKGIGTVLLARTLERMKQQGYHDAWVMWTDDIAARVYAKFGFSETRRFILMKKQL